MNRIDIKIDRAVVLQGFAFAIGSLRQAYCILLSMPYLLSLNVM
jgi:hypothetical protein